MPKRSRFNPQRLRDLRELQGLSVEAFAKRIGKTGRSIMNWERGVTSPTMRDLEAICEAFDVDLASFLVSTPARQKESVVLAR